MRQEWRDVGTDKRDDLLVEHGWQRCIREHFERDILPQEIGIRTDAVREERLRGIVQPCDITSWRGLASEHRTIAQVQFESDMRPHYSRRGEAEIVTLRDNLFMR